MRNFIFYHIRLLCLPTAMITLTLVGMVTLLQSLRLTDMIINRGIGISDFLKLSIYMIPSLLVIILPISTFIACLYSYHRMNQESELVIWRAAGVSPRMLWTPTFYFAVGVTLISYFLTLYLSPLGYTSFKERQAHLRYHYASLLLQEGVFNIPVPGVTLYIHHHDQNNRLYGIIIEDSRLKGKTITMTAQEGAITQNQTGMELFLKYGTRQENNYQDKSLTMLYFDEYPMLLDLGSSTTDVRWKQPEERWLTELFTDTSRPEMVSKLRAEGHHRLLWPLYIIVMVLVAVSSIINARHSRRGHTHELLVASVVAAGIILATMSIHTMMAHHILWVWGAYALLGLCLIFFWYQLTAQERQGEVA
jgi:lipopolysaccharide export system permease protein